MGGSTKHNLLAPQPSALDSYKPIDQGWPQVLADHPLPTVWLLHSLLAWLGTEAPTIGNQLFCHDLYSNPCMVEADCFLTWDRMWYVRCWWFNVIEA